MTAKDFTVSEAYRTIFDSTEAEEVKKALEEHERSLGDAVRRAVGKFGLSVFDIESIRLVDEGKPELTLEIELKRPLAKQIAGTIEV